MWPLQKSGTVDLLFFDIEWKVKSENEKRNECNQLALYAVQYMPKLIKVIYNKSTIFK